MRPIFQARQFFLYIHLYHKFKNKTAQETPAYIPRCFWGFMEETKDGTITPNKRWLDDKITNPSLRGFVLKWKWARKLIANSLSWCSGIFDPIFDPINLARCSQMDCAVGHISGLSSNCFDMFLAIAIAIARMSCLVVQILNGSDLKEVRILQDIVT